MAAFSSRATSTPANEYEEIKVRRRKKKEREKRERREKRGKREKREKRGKGVIRDCSRGVSFLEKEKEKEKERSLFCYI